MASITPGISRSGRVLKKSAKLLDMENDLKVKPKTTPKSGTTPPVKNESGVSDVNYDDYTLVSPVSYHDNEVTDQTLSISKDKGTVKKMTPLKSLALSDEALENQEVGSDNINSEHNIIPGAKTSSPSKVAVTTTTTPIKLTDGKVGKLIIRINNDNKLESTNKSTAIVKRTIESPATGENSEKKVKLELISSTPSPSKSSINVSNSRSSIQQQGVSATKTNKSVTAPPKVVVIDASQIKLNPLPPAVVAANQAKQLISRQFTSNSTTNSSLPSLISASSSADQRTSPVKIVRSIQEQKRLNQAEKSRLQQQQQHQFNTTVSTPNNKLGSNQYTNIKSVGLNNNHNHHEEHRPVTKSENKKPMGKHHVSAYVLWCREVRAETQARYPALDFVSLSRKMGEIWQHLPQNEKSIWFKKADMLTKSGVCENLYTQQWISDDLKPKSISHTQTRPITTEMVQTFNDTFVGETEQVGVYDNESHSIGTELIDLQAYLNLLGDSLQTIGSWLQRGVKYRSHLDYNEGHALSTLLDSALVAMGSLTALTQTIPQIAPKKESISRTLKNISYLMPPDDVTYNQ